MSARQSFLRSLATDPHNDLLRNVYADWLEENGEEEEARRQRNWAASYQFFVDFADGWSRRDGWETFTGDDLLDAIRREGEFVQGSCTPLSQSGLEEDPQFMALFWGHYEVLTGEPVPELLLRSFCFTCEC